MEPTTDQVQVLAGALTQLRSATAPAARVQAVRTATRAVQGLAAEDRQVLVERLLSHGAPVAAGAVSRHLDDVEVPAGAQTEIAQDLLGLAPVEVARIAEELLAAASVAAPPTVQTPVDPTWPPPTRPTTTASRPATGSGSPAPTPSTARADGGEAAAGSAEPPAPPPLPRTTRTRPSMAPGLRSPVLRQADPARRDAPQLLRRAVTGSRTDRWARLAAELEAAGRGRARRDLLAAVPGAVPADRLPELLAAVPAGWQRRMALRHLVTGPGIDGGVPLAVLDTFSRDGDRFAAAALLVRAGHLAAEEASLALPEPLAGRLFRRRTPVA